MEKFNTILGRTSLKIAAAVVLVGIGAGFFSFFLHELVREATHFLGTRSPFTLTTYAFALAAGLGSCFLTKNFFRETGGSGIPQVALALTTNHGQMLKRLPFGKFVTSFLTLCSGLSFGKEGPLVTISASWGYLVSHYLRVNHHVTQVLVASGASAGLAAAFNTPIAAVIFTIEEILGELDKRYLAPIIFTAVIASATSFALLGNTSTFSPLNYRFVVGWHIVLYPLLGLMMSLVGIVYIKSVLLLKNFRKIYFKQHDYLFIALVISVMAICSQYSGAVLGDGAATINTLLSLKIEDATSFIIVLFVLKLFLSASSYSTGLSGGLFMPVLLLGALGGSAFATVLIKLGFAQIEIGAFALIGMTSMLVAVIRTPFTAFVLLFEMTRDYELILPLMVSSVVAYWLSSALNPGSIYESVGIYEGVHLPTHDDSEYLSDMEVEKCLSKERITLDAKRTVAEYNELLSASNQENFPAINNNQLVGIVDRKELLDNIVSKNHQVGDFAKNVQIHIHPDQNMLIALQKMKHFSVTWLPVTSRTGGNRFLGTVNFDDIIAYIGGANVKDE